MHVVLRQQFTGNMRITAVGLDDWVLKWAYAEKTASACIVCRAVYSSLCICGHALVLHR